MEYGNNTNYIPHSNLEGLPLKINITKIWDESHVLSSLINDQQKDEKEYLIEAQVVVNGQPQPLVKTLKNFKKAAIHDESIHFNTTIKELSYNSMIGITIWSSQKDYNENSPLGSTTLPLFDENFRLREGQLNLLIWPNVAPDLNESSKTPGIIIDKNIENLNFCCKKIENIQNNSSDTNQNLSLSNLRLKLFYCYKTIPSAFLEVRLPKFPVPVLFEDYEYPMDESLQQVLGGGYNSDIAAVQSTKIQQKLFIDQTEISDTFQIADFDFEQGRQDPVQEMFGTILRYDEHPETLVPSKYEADNMKSILLRPIIGEIKSDIRDLFWKYRYWASQFGAALPYFLVSTKWNNQGEEAEALKLMAKWEPIQIEDVLFLLSSYTCANEFKKTKRPKHCMIEIRKYAVKTLKEFPDEKLENVLLQLVSALKYEPLFESTLVQLLFERASQSKSLATYLFWYLHVEQDNQNKNIERNQITEWFKQIYEEFCVQLQMNNPNLHLQINNQQIFRRKLLAISLHIKGMKVDKKQKLQFLREKLSSAEFQEYEQLPKHPCCLCPEIDLMSSIPEKANIFSSAMAPIKMAFKSKGQENDDEFRLIFKSGDDLRQDQLIMQLFNLMNFLLQGVSQDMRLLPYKILACSKSDGFLEFVPEATTIQDILDKTSISAYLKSISEEPLNKMGINRTIMENYILSSAGYCVMTYFLGIGDRHQENLLINNEGKMFHIDFGFILGKDPKPYPPPFKMCKEQVEGMGGMKSEYFFQFKKKCVDVYNYLRSYAKLFIYLLYLMSDSGIKDYSQEALEQMYEKFRLDDSDEMAEIHFLGLLEDSVNSLFPQMTDAIHKWVNYWRR